MSLVCFAAILTFLFFSFFWFSVMVLGQLFFLFQISEYAANNDAILLIVIPASQAPEISSSRALRLAKEFDSDGLC